MLTSWPTRLGARWCLLVGALVAGAACSTEHPGSPSPPTTGLLSVTTITTGGEYDVDGYLLHVAGQDQGAIELNASRWFGQLTPGERAVELTDIAPNCSVPGDNWESGTMVAGAATSVTSLATIVAGATTSVRFELTCLARPEFAALRLIFARDGQIYSMNGDGTGLTQLTADESWNHSAAVSPDGMNIAFVSNRDGVYDPFEDYRFGESIYLRSAGEGGSIRLTFGAEDRDPAWSPDGTKIAFTSSLGISVVHADGEHRVEMDGWSTDHAPAWSPDGGRIAFTRTAENSTPSIWIMNADGSGPTRLTQFASIGPVWSPDGSKLAFSGFGTNTDRASGEVYVMNRDGSGVVQLTSGEMGLRAGGWSADGRYIALSRGREYPGNPYWGHPGNIYLIEVGSGSLARLTADSRAYESSPAFWPEPKAVAGR